MRRAPDAVGALAEVLHNLGQAYGARQDERAFALFDEVTALATEHEAGWLLADVTDSRGRALAQFGRIGRGRRRGAHRRRRIRRDRGQRCRPADPSCSPLDCSPADERAGDAVPIYRSALEHGEAHPPLRQVAALELGDTLEALGRHGEAAEVRALIES